MTYDAIDQSIDSGEPIELYEFTRDDMWSMRLSTAQTPFVEGNWTYEPSPIRRNRLRQSDELERDNIELTVPRGNPLAQEFLGAPSDFVASLTIKRLHRGLALSDAEVIWKGRVTGGEADGETAKIGGESVFTSSRRMGLRPKYERICRHPLYSAECGANQPAVRVDDDIITLDGMTMEIQDAGQYDGGYFNGGILEYQGRRRFIVRHTGPNITIDRPLDTLAVAVTVAIFPGCNKTMEDCSAKFSNDENHGGFPWIPLKNPFEGLE